jgi:glycosyltransferase involved in cell wall biosynthesis
MLHHGAPPPLLQIGEEAKAQVGLQGRRVLSTFGLVNRGKGLEDMVKALPQILQHTPETCYLIVGQTHPGEQRCEKERYREELMQLAERLGVGQAIHFINKYLTKAEISRYLAATDVYVTPYSNPHQICSGTLAYAMAAGKAIVSTPYLYARFLLGEGRGCLVDFGDVSALAQEICGILQNPARQSRLELAAGVYGRQMYWKQVGEEYRALFHSLLQQPAVQPTTITSAAIAAA